MAKTVKAMRETVKATVIAQLIQALTVSGEDVGMSGSAEFNFPVVLEDGSEDFVVVKVSIPTGSRDGEPYDGYGMRTDYSMKCQERKEKAEAAAIAKAKKIEKDKARREKAAANKANAGK